ncbi:transporter substrate-binding domain-containing protein [Amycolatopsis mongoliensis]|uniref:Transporter substrate-binding domain-containing protein n=1 Tax=Amycolatopsis mongoliensis TaxID=715475 RepID=A0A9Y2JP57_9PSEU|nr:transporter substrate-binding domain-containing protein [Amycolatopsis sp. 4-36]WIY00967.1 transporter substrate-binding domain-containing protein [Amycolatopsis sp. 4-36]
MQSLRDALPQVIKDTGVIRFAGDSHPPYRTVAENGTVTGLSAALQGMLGNRYGPVKATAEREKQFDTITWMTTRTAYVFPVDSTAGTTRTEDPCGKRVAVVTASVVEEQLNKLSRFCTQNKRPATQTIGLDDTNGTLLATRSGRADAAGMTEAAAIDVTRRQGAYKYVTQTEAQGATKDDPALYVPKSSKPGPVLQQVFEELFENGTYVGIMSRWGLNRVSVPEPVFNAATSG